MTIDKKKTCVVFGSFDGMHRGHRAILKRAEEEGRVRGLPLLMVSGAGDRQQVLTTEEEKEYLAGKNGVDTFLSINIEEGKMKTKRFVDEILVRELRAEVVVTEAGRSEIPLLEAVGITVVTVKSVRVQGQRVTAAEISAAVRAGDLPAAAKLSGHAYFMIGEVVHGKAFGRTVGMPTANLSIPQEKIKPPNGVYATLSRIDGRFYEGVTNVGTRPSVDNLEQITVETFIQNFSRDIYGDRIVLGFYDFIRPVKKFSGLAEVKAQVERDVVTAGKQLARWKRRK